MPVFRPHVQDWLEHQGIEFDIHTDEDLHREGVDLLRRYRVVLTGSHPEYNNAFDGKFGGMWRARGRIPSKLCGLTFTAYGFDVYSGWLPVSTTR